MATRVGVAGAPAVGTCRSSRESYSALAHPSARAAVPADSNLTELELAFRALIAGVKTSSGRVEVNPSYSLQCQVARARWMAAHVEYQHDDGSWHPDPPENAKTLIAWRHKR